MVLQGKLELITGIPAGNQQLAIYNDADSQPARVIDDDQRPLGFYSPADFQVLKVRTQRLDWIMPQRLIFYLNCSR